MNETPAPNAPAHGAPVGHGSGDRHLDPVAAPEMIDTACPAYFVDL